MNPGADQINIINLRLSCAIGRPLCLTCTIRQRLYHSRLYRWHLSFSCAIYWRLHLVLANRRHLHNSHTIDLRLRLSCVIIQRLRFTRANGRRFRHSYFIAVNFRKMVRVSATPIQFPRLKGAYLCKGGVKLINLYIMFLGSL